VSAVTFDLVWAAQFAVQAGLAFAGCQQSRSRQDGIVRLPAFIERQLECPSGLIAPLTALGLNRANRAANEAAIEALRMGPKASVLDIGYGGGIGLRMLLSQLADGLVAGIDPSEDLDRRACRVFATAIATGRLDVRVGRADSLPWSAGSFDAVLAVNSVNCWPDLTAGLEESFRVLKRGGRMVAVLAIVPSLATRVSEQLVALVHGSELADTMAAVGFHDVVADQPNIPHRHVLRVSGDRRSP